MFILAFVGCVLIDASLDGDFYFLYSFGRSIANDGFPVKDVLSMHSDMNIIVQQWLVDVLFYYAYEFLGKAGVLAIVYVMDIVYIIMLYKLCRLVTDNFFVSVIVTTLSGILVSVIYMVTRPQIFTYIIFILLLFFLEKYVRTGHVCWLCLLPVLSILQINVHASMWLMLFVLMMPYLVSCFSINLPFYQQQARCRLWHLLLTMAAMTAGALLNPYGYRSILYLVGSFGVDSINQAIMEMQSTNISDAMGILYFGILFLMVSFMLISKRKRPELRFLCLALGTTVLGLTSYKANVYFYIVGFVCFAHYFRDFDFPLKVTSGKRTKKEKIRLAVLVGLLVLALGYTFFSPSAPYNSRQDARAEQLEPVASYLDTQNRDDMVLYAGFNEGSILEFHGYHPYIDGRAELFLKAKNGQFDYFDEYLDADSGRSYYRDFLDKYGFTHLVVPTGQNHLYVSIVHDSDYEQGYSDDNYTVFVKKN